VPLFMMELGEVVVGGVGAGLYGMLIFVILAVFIAGLMVGRTPEYLGKKIEAKEVKLAMLTLLVLTLSILGFTAWACVRSLQRRGSQQRRTAWLRGNSLRLQFRDGEQRKRLCRSDREHTLVQYDTGARHADWTLPHDRPDYGARRIPRGQTNRAAQRGHLSGRWRDVHHLADWNRAPDRSPEFPTGPGSRPNRGALPHCPRKSISKPDSVMSHKAISLFDSSILTPAISESFKKLDPRLMIKNPVMFVTLVGAVLTTSFYHNEPQRTRIHSSAEHLALVHGAFR